MVQALSDLCPFAFVGNVSIICHERQLAWVNDLNIDVDVVLVESDTKLSMYGCKRIPAILFHDHGLSTSGIKLSTAVNDLERYLKRVSRRQKQMS